MTDGGGQLRILNEPRKQMIESCAELASEINLKLEWIKKERDRRHNNPNHDLEELSQYRKKLESLISKMKKRVCDCLGYVDCNTDMKGLDLPEEPKLTLLIVEGKPD